MFAHAYAPKEERVEFAGRFYALDDLVPHMDEDIYAEAGFWAGVNATHQAILDIYLRLHRNQHGKPFELPR